MGSSKQCLGGVIALIALNGCYRSAVVESKEVAEIRVAERSAHILYRNGDTREIDSFDTVMVRDAQGKHLFRDDVSGGLRGGTLQLKDAQSEYTLLAEDLRYVEVERYAPERPWIIIGATVGATVLGGVVGSSAGSCAPDSGTCVQSTLGMFSGAVIGLSLTLPLSILLTDTLGTVKSPTKEARRGGFDNVAVLLR